MSGKQSRRKSRRALRAKFAKLAEKRGWPKEEAEERSLSEIGDARTAELDSKSDELLGRIDALGRPPESGAIDCTRIGTIKATGAELLSVMKDKAEYTTAKLDKALGIAPAPPQVAEAPAKPAAAPKEAPVAAPPPQPSKAAPAPPPWQTTAEGKEAMGPAVPGPSGSSLPPGMFTPDGEADGYSIEEIRDATNGFFGAVSTNLATVLEHAFSVAGRPTAYVLGTEGGGAFLAGLRYGEGTLFMRSGGRSKVYWHGPSIGTDFGASGSRTLFLIYKLKEPGDLYRTFTGIDGSAYLVGGIGLTLMKGGSAIMAPIRSGVGLRLGANIGYVRFTPNGTWNPF